MAVSVSDIAIIATRGRRFTVKDTASRARIDMDQIALSDTKKPKPLI